MNESTTITIRVRAEDKVRFQTFCKKVGLTPSTAIHIFIKEVIKRGAIPFPIIGEEK